MQAHDEDTQRLLNAISAVKTLREQILTSKTNAIVLDHNPVYEDDHSEVTTDVRRLDDGNLFNGMEQYKDKYEVSLLDDSEESRAFDDLDNPEDPALMYALSQNADETVFSSQFSTPLPSGCTTPIARRLSVSSFTSDTSRSSYAYSVNHTLPRNYTLQTKDKAPSNPNSSRKTDAKPKISNTGTPTKVPSRIPTSTSARRTSPYATLPAKFSPSNMQNSGMVPSPSVIPGAVSPSNSLKPQIPPKSSSKETTSGQTPKLGQNLQKVKSTTPEPKSINTTNVSLGSVSRSNSGRTPSSGTASAELVSKRSKPEVARLGHVSSKQSSQGTNIPIKPTLIPSPPPLRLEKPAGTIAVAASRQSSLKAIDLLDESPLFSTQVAKNADLHNELLHSDALDMGDAQFVFSAAADELALQQAFMPAQQTTLFQQPQSWQAGQSPPSYLHKTDPISGPHTMGNPVSRIPRADSLNRNTPSKGAMKELQSALPTPTEARLSVDGNVGKDRMDLSKESATLQVSSPDERVSRVDSLDEDRYLRLFGTTSASERNLFSNALSSSQKSHSSGNGNTPLPLDSSSSFMQALDASMDPLPFSEANAAEPDTLMDGHRLPSLSGIDVMPEAPICNGKAALEGADREATADMHDVELRPHQGEQGRRSMLLMGGDYRLAEMLRRNTSSVGGADNTEALDFILSGQADEIALQGMLEAGSTTTSNATAAALALLSPSLRGTSQPGIYESVLDKEFTSGQDPSQMAHADSSGSALEMNMPALAEEAARVHQALVGKTLPSVADSTLVQGNQHVSSVQPENGAFEFAQASFAKLTHSNEVTVSPRVSEGTHLVANGNCQVAAGLVGSDGLVTEIALAAAAAEIGQMVQDMRSTIIDASEAADEPSEPFPPIASISVEASAVKNEPEAVVEAIQAVEEPPELLVAETGNYVDSTRATEELVKMHEQPSDNASADVVTLQQEEKAFVEAGVEERSKNELQEDASADFTKEVQANVVVPEEEKKLTAAVDAEKERGMLVNEGIVDIPEAAFTAIGDQNAGGDKQIVLDAAQQAGVAESCEIESVESAEVAAQPTSTTITSSLEKSPAAIHEEFLSNDTPPSLASSLVPLQDEQHLLVGTLEGEAQAKADLEPAESESSSQEALQVAVAGQPVQAVIEVDVPSELVQDVNGVDVSPEPVQEAIEFAVITGPVRAVMEVAVSIEPAQAVLEAAITTEPIPAVIEVAMGEAKVDVMREEGAAQLASTAEFTQVVIKPESLYQEALQVTLSTEPVQAVIVAATVAANGETEPGVMPGEGGALLAVTAEPAQVLTVPEFIHQEALQVASPTGPLQAVVEDAMEASTGEAEPDVMIMEDASVTTEPAQAMTEVLKVDISSEAVQAASGVDPDITPAEDAAQLAVIAQPGEAVIEMARDAKTETQHGDFTELIEVVTEAVADVLIAEARSTSQDETQLPNEAFSEAETEDIAGVKEPEIPTADPQDILWAEEDSMEVIEEMHVANANIMVGLFTDRHVVSAEALSANNARLSGVSEEFPMEVIEDKATADLQVKAGHYIGSRVTLTEPLSPKSALNSGAYESCMPVEVLTYSPSESPAIPETTATYAFPAGSMDDAFAVPLGSRPTESKLEAAGVLLEDEVVVAMTLVHQPEVVHDVPIANQAVTKQMMKGLLPLFDASNDDAKAEVMPDQEDLQHASKDALAVSVALAQEGVGIDESAVMSSSTIAGAAISAEGICVSCGSEPLEPTSLSSLPDKIDVSPETLHSHAKEMLASPGNGSVTTELAEVQSSAEATTSPLKHDYNAGETSHASQKKKITVALVDKLTVEAEAIEAEFEAREAASHEKGPDLVVKDLVNVDSNSSSLTDNFVAEVMNVNISKPGLQGGITEHEVQEDLPVEIAVRAAIEHEHGAEDVGSEVEAIVSPHVKPVPLGTAKAEAAIDEGLVGEGAIVKTSILLEEVEQESPKTLEMSEQVTDIRTAGEAAKPSRGRAERLASTLRQMFMATEQSEILESEILSGYPENVLLGSAATERRPSTLGPTAVDYDEATEQKGSISMPAAVMYQQATETSENLAASPLLLEAMVAREDSFHHAALVTTGTVDSVSELNSTASQPEEAVHVLSESSPKAESVMCSVTPEAMPNSPTHADDFFDATEDFGLEETAAVELGEAGILASFSEAGKECEVSHSMSKSLLVSPESEFSGANELPIGGSVLQSGVGGTGPSADLVVAKKAEIQGLPEASSTSAGLGVPSTAQAVGPTDSISGVSLQAHAAITAGIAGSEAHSTVQPHAGLPTSHAASRSQPPMYTHTPTHFGFAPSSPPVYAPEAVPSGLGGQAPMYMSAANPVGPVPGDPPMYMPVPASAVYVSNAVHASSSPVSSASNSPCPPMHNPLPADSAPNGTHPSAHMHVPLTAASAPNSPQPPIHMPVPIPNDPHPPSTPLVFAPHSPLRPPMHPSLPVPANCPAGLSHTSLPIPAAADTPPPHMYMPAAIAEGSASNNPNPQTAPYTYMPAVTPIASAPGSLPPSGYMATYNRAPAIAENVPAPNSSSSQPEHVQAPNSGRNSPHPSGITHTLLDSDVSGLQPTSPDSLLTLLPAAALEQEEGAVSQTNLSSGMPIMSLDVYLKNRMPNGQSSSGAQCVGSDRDIESAGYNAEPFKSFEGVNRNDNSSSSTPRKGAKKQVTWPRKNMLAVDIEQASQQNSRTASGMASLVEGQDILVKQGSDRVRLASGEPVVKSNLGNPEVRQTIPKKRSSFLCCFRPVIDDDE